MPGKLCRNEASHTCAQTPADHRPGAAGNVTATRSEEEGLAMGTQDERRKIHFNKSLSSLIASGVAAQVGVSPRVPAETPRNPRPPATRMERRHEWLWLLAAMCGMLGRDV